MKIRVRYAPSPTGYQHIGGLRTALFNYLFARSQKGTFILRIEDTDQERSEAKYLEDFYQTLKWIGIQWDEGPDIGGEFGPYIQSERIDLYRKYARELIEKGEAYYCFCSSERLAALREEQNKRGKGETGYDRRCRSLPVEEALKKIDSGEPFVIRFKVPLEGETLASDILLGEIKRMNQDINPDPVLLKTDGFPTYHLANVIDDHLMEITHILRAQEWLPSCSLHILLYKAFGWTPPFYCHLPMVMGADGSKLSKRHGATSVIDFKKNGYLPEALLNYVSLLGWSYDDSREFFTKNELEELFLLQKINKAPAVFDYKKLEWFNGQYIRSIPEAEYIEALRPFFQAQGVVAVEMQAKEMKYFSKVALLIRERLKNLSEGPSLASYLYEGSNEYDPNAAIPKKTGKQEVSLALLACKDLIKGFTERNSEENESMFRDKSNEIGLKLGQLLHPLRYAITGSTVSPPLFDSIYLLGEEETLNRLEKLIAAFDEFAVDTALEDK